MQSVSETFVLSVNEKFKVGVYDNTVISVNLEISVILKVFKK